MEKLNLEYLEDILTIKSVFGKEREILCPAIIDHVSDKTIRNPENLFILQTVRNHFTAHQVFPSLDEIKVYLSDDLKVKHFRTFVDKCQKLHKVNYERRTLLLQGEELFRQRILQAVVTDGYAQSVETGELDIHEVYAQIDAAMAIHLQDDLGLSIFRDADKYIHDLESEDSYLSTGFEWLDYQLGGGFLTNGGALYNFCAASNIGKSNMLKSLGCNLSKQGKNVLIVSLEMPRYIYANRFVSDLTNIPIGTLKKESEKIKNFLIKGPKDGYGDIVIKDYATGSITPQMLNSYVKRLEKQTGIVFDVVFVDYPELFQKPTTFGNQHHLAVADQYIQTRALSFYHQKPFVSVAQLNRSGYSATKLEVPSMANIGSSIGIATCSDFMGFMYADDAMKEVNQIMMSVGKSRFGPVNQSKVYNVDPLTLKLTEGAGGAHVVEVEVPKEEDEAEKLLMDMFG